MLNPFLKQLNALSTPGTSAAQFLKTLGPVHAQWHSANNKGTVSIGFLLFHWELIQRFKAVGGPAHFGSIIPFTNAQLISFHATYDVTDPVLRGDVASLENFSTGIGGIEQWHNNAHMAIGMAFHKNMMNPKTNVLLPQFWQLHYFINDRFEEKLGDFRSVPTATTSAVVAQLETTDSISRV